MWPNFLELTCEFDEKKLVSGFISVNLLMFDIDLVRVLNSQFDSMRTKEKRQEQRSVWRKFVFT